MVKLKLHSISSTPKGPFERGTHCIARVEHGYVLAKDEDKVIVISRRIGDRNRMGEKLNELRRERDRLNCSIEAIVEWMEE